MPESFQHLFGSNADRLLTPQLLAEHLSVSVKTLERWRLQGEGPAFVRISPKVIRYRTSDVIAFIEHQRRACTVCTG